MGSSEKNAFRTSLFSQEAIDELREYEQERSFWGGWLSIAGTLADRMVSKYGAIGKFAGNWAQIPGVELQTNAQIANYVNRGVDALVDFEMSIVIGGKAGLRQDTDLDLSLAIEFVKDLDWMSASKKTSVTHTLVDLTGFEPQIPQIGVYEHDLGTTVYYSGWRDIGTVFGPLGPIKDDTLTLPGVSPVTLLDDLNFIGAQLAEPLAGPTRQEFPQPVAKPSPFAPKIGPEPPIKPQYQIQAFLDHLIQVRIAKFPSLQISSTVEPGFVGQNTLSSFFGLSIGRDHNGDVTYGDDEFAAFASGILGIPADRIGPQHYGKNLGSFDDLAETFGFDLSKDGDEHAKSRVTGRNEPEFIAKGKQGFGDSSANGDPGPGVPGGEIPGDKAGFESQDKDKAFPILLDLDGTGIEIVELSHSTVFMDATGDGLLNRIAWAAEGNGVLFYDPDNTGKITEKRQFIFTEWDPTATSDIEALRSVFDTNGDGKLSGAELDDFKVMVTVADGSLVAKALSHVDIDITEIDLTADATHIELPDGSVITGQTTFTRSDSSTGTVADTTLVAESASYRVDQVESVNGSGTRTETSTGFNADGSIAFVITSVTTSDGSSITNSYDDNGDGVVDRLQTIVTTTSGTDTVETVTNKRGSDAATAVLENVQVTTTNADGSVVTIDRDSLGGGWYDQTETRTTHLDGSRTIVVTDKGKDGTVYRTITETVSINGLIRDEEIDLDGDGVADTEVNHTIVVNGDGSRSETITTKNPDGTTRSSVTETVSADGQSKTIERDLDGDGQTDTEEDLDIVVNGNGTTSSTLTIRNDDGTMRRSTTQTQSDDALSKTSVIDEDGDGDTDVTRADVTTINLDDSRETLITETNGDGSVRSKQKTTLGADKVSSETWVDLNQDGTFQTTDLVRKIEVDGTTQERTDTSYQRSADGTVISTMTSVTSADGLSSTTDVDENADGNAETETSSVTVVNSNGSTTETITVRNQDASLRSGSVIDTTADGLTITTSSDIDGDGTDDEVGVTSWVTNLDDSITTTESSYAGDGTTLLSKTVTDESADRRVMTVTTDTDGDGQADRITTSTQALDGSSTSSSIDYAPNGATVRSSTTATSADGLTVTTTEDFDDDGAIDIKTESVTVLNNDGSRATTTTVRNGDLSLRSQSVETIRDDGYQITIQTDADGDGTFERETKSTTTLKTDGSVEVLDEVRSEDTTLLSQMKITTSDDGLVVTTEDDADGDGSFDLITTSTTTLQNDGDTDVATETRDGANQLRSASTLSTSDNGRSITATEDVNGDGNDDMVTTEIIGDDGVLTITVSEQSETGALQSRTETVTSANGLSTTASTDADGDGTYEIKTERVTALNADGSRTTTETLKGGNGTVHSEEVTTLSDDGLSTTSAADLDGDGDDDVSMVSTLSITSTGVRTETVTETAADASTLSTSTTVTSADRRTVTTDTDVDGNGNNDSKIVTTLEDNGDTQFAASFYSSGGTLEATRTERVSANGFERTVETDRNADGIAEHTLFDLGGVYSNGNEWREVSHYDGRSVLLAREEYLTSGDGLFALARLDLDGDGLNEFVTDTLTEYEADGDMIATATTLDENQAVIYASSTTTSGNGLATLADIDFDGDGNTNQMVHTVLGAAGGLTATTEDFGPGSALQRSETLTVSADGWTETREIDRDGDLALDRRIVADTDDSWTTTTTYEDLDAVGNASARVTTVLTANGMSFTATFDVDADGSADFTQALLTSFDVAGNEITSFTESVGAQTIYQETTTSAANGLSSTTTIDHDGDGTTDATRIETITLNDNGSRDLLDETTYADGDLRSRSEVSVSSDGRHIIERHDYDGNGLVDQSFETLIRSDGETTITERSFNESGYENSTFVTNTSSDGLVQTINRDGVVQTTTWSPADNGSYTWDNGETGADAITSTHELDAMGVDSWTYVTDSATTEIRLDADAKARLFAEAERIFDTVLDRDLDVEEYEFLATQVVDGQLDRTGLADLLITSDEFDTRYGTLTDAEFITQMYLNAYGRAPGLKELNTRLEDLAVDGVAREALAEEISESVEHLAVGNGHRLTNNFDVVRNPAEFERSLDEAYVEEMVKGLIDVAYDRDATAHELEHFSNLLLDGDDTAEDVATTLLAGDGGVFGTGTNSLKGLSGIALVDQAFQNAMGRAPSVEERADWSGHLTTGRISAAQFVASLSMSLEHLEDGSDSHVAGAPTASTQNGGAGTDVLSGTTGQDALNGNGGNDTLYGNNDSDQLTGGAGDDYLDGQAGGDVYVWSKGDGNDTINDNVVSATDTDRLELTDVVSTDVALTRASGSNHMDITIVSTGETIQVQSQLYQYAGMGGRGIEEIAFSDGVTWTLEDIEAQTRTNGSASGEVLNGSVFADNMHGLDGNDTLYGNTGDDTLTGGLGDDHLDGQGGSDSFVWAKGDGNDEIRDNTASQTDTDRLILTDVASTDVALTRDNGGTVMFLTVVSTNETIDVISQYWPTAGYGLEAIEFSDGVVWSLADIRAETKTNGTATGEVVNGSIYEDNLYGLGGNDTAYGGTGDDTLIGGAGADLLQGQADSDTYIWSIGDGNDTIYDNNASPLGTTDTLILTDVDADDVALVRASGSYDFHLNVQSSGESIKVQSQYWYGSEGHGLEAIEFGDGVAWGLDDILGAVRTEGTAAGEVLNGSVYQDNIYGLGGNDTAYGGTGDDVLVGGAGTDNLQGAAGSDLYIWSKGEGGDTILDNSTSFTEVDSLRLTDVSIGEVDLSQSGNDLKITITSTGEVLTDTSRFYSATASYGLEFIDLADGTKIEVLANPVAESIITGTSGNNVLSGWGFKDNIHGLEGNDTLYGNGGDDTLTGDEGSDHLDGQAGSDTYLWTIGDGDDEIRDNTTSLTDIDRLEFTDVTSSDVALTRASGGTVMFIEILSSGETIDVTSQFWSTGGYGLEEIAFSDGVVWTLADIRAETRTNGTSGNDMQYGSVFRDNIFGLDGNDYAYGGNGDDHLIGGAGVDHLEGQAGSDTYIWSTGDGNDTVYDNNASPGGTTDRLVLTDVASTGVELIRASGSYDYHVNVQASGESIKIQSEFWYATEGHGVEEIEFSDGVIWDHAEIRANVRTEGTAGIDALHGSVYGDNIFGLGGNDNAYGGNGDDLMVGGLGADSLDGGSGSDTYRWTKGDGADIINDTVLTMDDIDLLEFTDVVSTDVKLTRASGSTHMDIEVLSTGETLQVQHQFYQYWGTMGRGIEAVSFSDGVTWDFDQLLAEIRVEGTSGAETLNGTAYFRDNLFGLGGNDVLYGNSGDDHLVGGTGSDSLHGQSGNDTFEFSLGDGADSITDFDENDDMILFRGTGLTFGDLTITQSGTTTTVDYGGDTIAFLATDIADLTADKFVFV